MSQIDIIKKCIKCARPKPLAEFYRAPKNRDGHDNICKECARKSRMWVYFEKQRKKQATIEGVRKYIRGKYASVDVWLNEVQVVRDGVWLGAEGEALLERKIEAHIKWMRKHPKKTIEEVLV